MVDHNRRSRELVFDADEVYGLHIGAVVKHRDLARDARNHLNPDLDALRSIARRTGRFLRIREAIVGGTHPNPDSFSGYLEFDDDISETLRGAHHEYASLMLEGRLDAVIDASFPELSVPDTISLLQVSKTDQTLAALDREIAAR